MPHLAATPVLYIHVEGDREVPIEHTLNLAAASLNPNDQVWRVPGSAHCGAYVADPVAYVARCLDFIEIAVPARLPVAERGLTRAGNPRNAMPSALDAITDVRGIRVGHWTYRRGATGCSVVLCTDGAVGGVDGARAAPGTRETDLLRPGNLVQEVHAVVLSGLRLRPRHRRRGRAVYLADRGIGLHTRFATVPIVPAAILFDLGVGTKRTPDATAGQRAARRATPAGRRGQRGRGNRRHRSQAGRP